MPQTPEHFSKLFRPQDARAQGFTRKRLEQLHRRGQTQQLAHGLYRLGTDPTTRTTDLIRFLTSKPGHVLSHESAAAWWGIAENLGPPFHLTTLPGHNRIQRPGIVHNHRHSVPAEFITTSHGLPITSPAWTWLDIACRSSLTESLVLADAIISTSHFGRSRTPLTTPGELARAINARGRSRGIVTARNALKLARVGVDSPPETLLRLLMHNAGFPEPIVNQLITCPHTGHTFRPDLALLKQKIAIQYEGAEVHSTPDRVLKDVQRAELAESLGWLEVRITKTHMKYDGAAALSKITAALRKRGWSPGQT